VPEVKSDADEEPAVAQTLSPRRKFAAEALPLASRAVAMVPLVICEAAKETASDPPLAWLLAWLEGLRESLKRLSLPAQ
jgi:hypothetical protein